jgi:hypothetical protein
MTVKPPPKKWEPWVAGFLLLIYLGNASREGGPEDPLTNDLFLFASIIWFIAIAVRRRRYERTVRLQMSAHSGQTSGRTISHPKPPKPTSTDPVDESGST